MSDWDYPQPFCLQFDVQDTHIDELGHVNNAVYTQWCQEAAWRHSVDLGLSAADFRELGRAMAIQSAEYSYLAPAFCDERLELGTWLTASDGRFRMERRFQIRNAASGKDLFRGVWQLACINLANGKPARMPEIFRRSYEPAVVVPS